MTELHHLTLAELNEGLRARRFSSVELTRHFLARIERLNPTLNALITVTAEQALAAAQRADQLLASGEAGALAGLPIIHKDIFCTDGVLTTCGSRMLSNFVAPYDATVIRHLKEAGVPLLGKLNQDEFAILRCRHRRGDGSGLTHPDRGTKRRRPAPPLPPRCGAEADAGDGPVLTRPQSRSAGTGLDPDARDLPDPVSGSR